MAGLSDVQQHILGHCCYTGRVQVLFVQSLAELYQPSSTAAAACLLVVVVFLLLQVFIAARQQQEHRAGSWLAASAL